LQYEFDKSNFGLKNHVPCIVLLIPLADQKLVINSLNVEVISMSPFINVEAVHD